MKRFLALLKSTLLGGLIVMLPAWLAVLLVLKALAHLQIFVKPIGSHLPRANAHRKIITILVLFALCFLVGIAIRTAIGARAKCLAKHAVLEKIPGYTTLRGFAAQLADQNPSASFQPALVEIEEALVPGFIVEQHSGNRSTVFLPSVPTPMAGAVYIIDNRRVHRLDIPAVAVLQCISKWGGGSDKLVAAYDAARLSLSESTNKQHQDQRT